MRPLIPFILGCLAFLSFACEYSPSGDHYEEINPKPEIIADIFLDQQQDTIVVRGNLAFNFSISLPGRSLYGYQLTLGNVVLEEGNSLEGSHVFVSKRYPDGYHQLQLKALGNSGTGSLADKSMAEVLTIYRTWVVYIDNARPDPVAITSIRPENGQLKIEWQPTKRLGFRWLEVVKYEGSSSTTVLASFTSPDSTSWIDPHYVGGSFSYMIVVHSDNHLLGGTKGPHRTYNYPVPRILHVTHNEANDLVITFSATPFYKNFRKYELTSPTGLTFSSTDSKDTVVTFPDRGFGEDHAVKLATFPTSRGNSWYDRGMTTESKVLGFGTACGPFRIPALFRRHESGVFYDFSTSRFRLIDPVTLQVKQERETFFNQIADLILPQNAVSENANHVYSFYNNTIHRLHPSTLQTIETYPLADLLPKRPYTKVSLNGVSNTNRLLIAVQTPSRFDSLFLVDMSQKRVIQKRFMYFFRDALISADGKALKETFSLFVEQQDGDWMEQKLPEGDFKTLAFHPAEPVYYLRRGRNFDFHSSGNGALLKTITTETELADYGIDAGSGYLYGTANGMMYIYNTGTGELKRKLKLAPFVTAFVYKDRIFTHDRFIPL